MRAALLVLLAALAMPPALAQAPGAAKVPNAILLVTRPGMTDPNFTEAVVLVTQSPEYHTVGVILNRPTSSKHPASGEAVYFGGPVMREVLVALFQAKQPPETAFPVLKGLYLSMHPDDVQPLLKQRERRYRLYRGFSGWGPGQLESEMKRGIWLVLPATEEIALRKDTKGMWKELAERALKRSAPRAAAGEPLVRLEAR